MRSGALARVFAAACLFLAAACAQCQDSTGARQVRFRTYSTPEGLSQATSRAIAQDRDGFIWVGTQDGLNRFDGYGFRIYKHARGEPWSLPQNHVWTLLADPDGGLWVGSQTGGLSRYDPALDRFTPYAPAAPSDNSASRLVTALLRDRDGRIWVANGGGRLQWVDRAHERLIDTPLGEQASLQMVRALLQAKDGSIWIGTYQGLFRTDAQARAMTEVRAGSAEPLDVYALAQTPDGTLWIGTAEAGLYHVGAAGEAIAHYRHDAAADDAFDLPDDEVRALLADDDGGLWVGTNTHGAAWLDPKTRQFAHFTPDPTRSDALAANRVSALFRARDGLLFVGTWTNGFSVHDPRSRAFTLIDRVREGATTLAVPSSAVHADADSTLWGGVASGGGLVHLDLAGQLLRHYRHDPARADSLTHDFVRYITRTPDGTLWVATDGGLDRLKADGSGFEHLHHDATDPASLPATRSCTSTPIAPARCGSARSTPGSTSAARAAAHSAIIAMTRPTRPARPAIRSAACVSCATANSGSPTAPKAWTGSTAPAGASSTSVRALPIQSPSARTPSRCSERIRTAICGSARRAAGSAIACAILPAPCVSKRSTPSTGWPPMRSVRSSRPRRESCG